MKRWNFWHVRRRDYRPSRKYETKQPLAYWSNSVTVWREEMVSTWSGRAKRNRTQSNSSPGWLRGDRDMRDAKDIVDGFFSKLGEAGKTLAELDERARMVRDQQDRCDAAKAD